MAIADVPQAIQLALGPAFLLTGIAGLLNVMTGRLARIIDRGRLLAEQPGSLPGLSDEARQVELRGLERRRSHASAAITACTAAALLVCLVILALFLAELVDVPLRGVVGALFAASTLTLVVGLGYFLREVQLATQMVRIPGVRDPR